jgi:hypothetical protein
MNAHSPIMPKWATERGLTPLQWQTLQEDKARKLRMGFEGPPPVRLLPRPIVKAKVAPTSSLEVAPPPVPYRIRARSWYQRQIREAEALAATEMSISVDPDINPALKQSAHILAIKKI